MIDKGRCLSWVWKDDLEFSKGQRAEQRHIFPEESKVSTFDPKLHLHSTKMPSYFWCPNSLGYLVTARKSITLFQVRTECVESTAPLRGLQESPVSPQKTEKQLTSFNWVLPDKAVWKPAELSQRQSLPSSWVISETHPSLPDSAL